VCVSKYHPLGWVLIADMTLYLMPIALR